MAPFVRLTLTLALLAAPAASLAQQPSGPVPWANKFFQKDNTPAVLVHDFGTIPGGTVAAHKFTITNIYDVPMQVIAVEKSCGCLEAYPPKHVLQPNESAEFGVTMDAGKFRGANAQTFRITFGPQYTSTAVIRVQAYSRTDVLLTPGQVNFGVVAQGAKPTQTVTLKYQGRQRDWKITGVADGNGPFDVKVEEPGRFSFGNEFKIAVSLKDSAPAGSLAEQVILKTNDPTAPLIPVPVAGMIQAPLDVNPQKVSFSGIKVGESTTLRVMVRAAKPFKVTAPADDGDGVTVEVFPAATPVQIVTVRFAPTKVGTVAKTIRLKTDLNGGATALIPVEAEAVEK
ncbi:MAG TPA: DUF1573 domain-containing protein [Fimbriiglobus sp.]|jgi:hypothetical protein